MYMYVQEKNYERVQRIVYVMDRRSNKGEKRFIIISSRNYQGFFVSFTLIMIV